MNGRALRLVPPANISLVRTATVHHHPNHRYGHNHSPCLAKRTSRAKPSRHSSVVYFRPQDIQGSDLDVVDPGRSPAELEEPSFHQNHVSTMGIPLTSHIPLVQRIPLAKTATSLHQNLIYLINHHNPLPSLPSLLDYHDRHAGLRSTRSYNVLIHFAIRNAAYGSAGWLFRAMRADAVADNLETWKLRVRWLVQSGRWDQASSEALCAAPASPGVGQDKPRIPLPIWLEFFRTLKRGSIRRRTIHWHSRRGGRATTGLEPVQEDTDAAGVYVARYRTLLEHRPMSSPEELTPPRAVYAVVTILFKCGESDLARSLTKSYFTSLPSKISGAWARTCLGIVHLNIVFGSPHRGLRKFYETRRIFVSLVRLYAGLRPTSTTLFLLLAPLKDVKRCGTVGYKMLRAFKKQWGARTEDRRVRRRVATLAAKEGRMDIADKLLEVEGASRWAHGAWNVRRGVLGGEMGAGRRLHRLPATKMLKHNGREERHWCRFVRKMIFGRQRHGAVKREVSSMPASL